MLRAAELVGRDDEGRALRALVQRALAGAGGGLAIVGEAGIGKSALVRGALGGDALHGRATPPPSSPLRPLVELAMAAIARGARADDDRLRVHRAALATLLPGVALADGRTELPTPIHTADALLRLVRTLAPRPAVMLIEDLHWADAESLAAFEYLADRAGGGAVALIVTLRPGGEAETTVPRLHSRHSLDVIRLGPLDPAGVAGVAGVAASCLQDAGPSGLLELAAGLALRADNQARAAALLVAAGRNALALGLPGAAIRLLDQALTMLPPGEDAPAGPRAACPSPGRGRPCRSHG